MIAPGRSNKPSAFTASSNSHEAERAPSHALAARDGSFPARVGNAGMVKLMRAGAKQSAPPPPCPKVKDVDARVNQAKESWKMMDAGEATFTFNGYVRAGACQNIRYEWDFGDGETSSDLATTHTYTQPDVYEATLTARCDDCPDADAVIDSVKVVALRLDHTTSGAQVADHRRTELGVGEEMDFTVTPRLPEVTASVVGEGVINRTDVGEFTFKAPAQAREPIVFLESPMMTSFGLKLPVFAPTWITKQRYTSTVLAWDGPGVYLQTQARLHALDDQGLEHTVSFENLEVSSDPATAEDLTGYFAQLAPDWVYTNPGVSWSQVDASNLVWPTEDTLIKGPQFEPPPKWTDGSFLVVSRWRYRVKGDPAEFDLTKTAQSVEIEGRDEAHAPGTMTVYDQGACASRAPDDTEYPCRA
jgi:PKD repeat protein